MTNRRIAAGVSAVVIAAAVSVLVTLPFIFDHGLTATEGHRTIPGWTMLETGQWLPTQMFGAVYVRKPPGMPWAIAGMSALFGQEAWAARLASVVAAALMAIVAAGFGWRWMGVRGAWTIGLAQALTPRLVFAARTAEIEPLNHLGVQLACFALIDAAIRRDRTMLTWGCAALGLSIAVLAKGPAGAPFIGATLFAAMLIGGWRRPLAIGLSSAAFAGAIFGYMAWMSATMANPAAPLVAQGVGDFTWGAGTWGRRLSFVPEVIGTAMPMAMALVFPWGRDAARERATGVSGVHGAGWIAAAGAVWGVLILLFAGVVNARYASPGLVLLPVVVGYVAVGASGEAGFTDRRRRIARVLLPLGGWGWAAVLTAGLLLAPHRPDESGEAAGSVIAQVLGAQVGRFDGFEVWSNQIVDTRPEILWGVERDAPNAARVRWVPTLYRAPIPAGTFVVISPAEQARLEARGVELRFLYATRVHEFEVRVAEVIFDPAA